MTEVVPPPEFHAKVVLVGDGGAGRSGLAMRLAEDRWELAESGAGPWCTQLAMRAASGAANEDRCIWLWDFAADADQRLIHQLYLRDATVAILVFDGLRGDAMSHLWDWHRALSAVRGSFKRVLVAGRTDASPVWLASGEVAEFCEAAGFDAYFETSARDDIGCRALRDKLVSLIDWSEDVPPSLHEVTTRVSSAIMRLKESGRKITSSTELRAWLPEQLGAFQPADLGATLASLAAAGAVIPLGLDEQILLEPELLNMYAQAVIRTLGDDPYERGCIAEARVLRGELNYPEEFCRLPEGEERLLMGALHKLCTTQPISVCDADPRDRRPTMLVFPGYFRRDRPARPDSPQAFMSYRLTGDLDDIYVSLVVRLHHTELFEGSAVWRDAADFITASGRSIGIRVHYGTVDGRGQLDIYCEAETPPAEQLQFAVRVHNHLQHQGSDIDRTRIYICAVCSWPVDRAASTRRLVDGLADIICSNCERSRVSLWDSIEQELSDAEVRFNVESLLSDRVAMDSESTGRLLVAEVQALVARANQLAREVTVSDWGVDMEIEFKDDQGRATGCKLYLQLKSGDSHLYSRRTDGERVFRITSARHADYWADQQFPMMLVVRDSDGGVEWMEIGALLREQRVKGEWPARSIVFAGEPFDVMSIRRWRRRELGGR